MGQEPSPWRVLGALSQMGITFVVATALGLGVGYWIDRWLGSSPWLTLLGLGFGIASGFVNLFRSVGATDRADHDGS